ncbi:hypothetical protein T492DRAFT_117333 [Pavlovales sp. CCMP2436]|nr:hypothetical protein T492DRAFT_117333 [Pavlovales sp. CCMP2436]
MASHADKTVDLLYLDVTGAEWEVLPTLRGEGPGAVRQISAQLHFRSRAALLTAFSAMEQVGFRDYASTLSAGAVQQHSWLWCSDAQCLDGGGPRGFLPSVALLAKTRSAAHWHSRNTRPTQPPSAEASWVAADDPLDDEGARSRTAGSALSFDPLSPSWSCPAEEFVGIFGDGGKWVCNPRRLGWAPGAASPSPPGGARRLCTVYSLGGSTNTQFEQEMDRISACQIRTFDLNCFERYK